MRERGGGERQIDGYRKKEGEGQTDEDGKVKNEERMTNKRDDNPSR